MVVKVYTSLVPRQGYDHECMTLSTRGMETAIRTQKETINELEARIQANTEEIAKVHYSIVNSCSQNVCVTHFFNWHDNVTNSLNCISQHTHFLLCIHTIYMIPESSSDVIHSRLCTAKCTVFRLPAWAWGNLAAASVHCWVTGVHTRPAGWDGGQPAQDKGREGWEKLSCGGAHPQWTNTVHRSRRGKYFPLQHGLRLDQ